MALQNTFDEAGDITIIRCSGRIVAGAEIEKLEADLNSRIETCKRFVLNLREVTFLDSSGVGMIVRFAGTTKAAHGAVKLCELSEIVAKVMKLTRLDRVLEINPTEAEAIAAFKAKSKQEPAPCEGSKIVCVDASLNVLAYLRGLLTQHGYSVMTSANAYDARNLLKAVQPALVILGPDVPGMNLDNFQQALKGFPVLTLGPEFHANEAGAAAEALVARIKSAMDPTAQVAASN
jgi:anti-anti-sigma factor